MRMIAIRCFLLAFAMLAMLTLSAPSFAQVEVSITIAPPALPVYEQPLCPGDGYIWTPGYWAWGDDGYLWVPGTWVLAPEPGYLWTPGYWGWGDGVYIFHRGYWGPHIGFYGGINYGFGYFGHGYEGGRWEHNHFYYNRTVNNVNVVNIHNTYNETVINENTVNHVSYNGGRDGINERPTREENSAERERHIDPVAAQQQHVQLARGNPELRASSNHGAPPIAATARPADFKDHVPARAAGGAYTPPANRGNVNDRPENNNSRGNAVHPKDLPAFERPAPPNTGNSKLDQKYQQQQEKLASKQEQDRQKLQAKQDQQHQRMANQQANTAKMQQLEQRHQQQTQQMVQKHQQQNQRLQNQVQHASQPKNKR
ncbi:MAG: YXWGXW repeat-containing protein, partial [Candidatus Acidiferrales bacterium]